MEEVKKTFSEIADRYDSNRRKLIPCFDDFYRAVSEMAAFDAERSFRILDLGAGTGLLSEILRRRFAKAEMTLLDFSPEMLAQARQRFSGDSLVRFREGDYFQGDLKGPYELIVSSLSIHHLPDSDKRKLYQKVFTALVPGGQFINAEFVCSSSAEVQERYRRLWLRHIEGSGLTAAELEKAIERTKIDILAPVERQLDWLRELGFGEVDCYYRQYMFAVFGGKRPQT